MIYCIEIGHQVTACELPKMINLFSIHGFVIHISKLQDTRTGIQSKQRSLISDWFVLAVELVS